MADLLDKSNLTWVIRVGIVVAVVVAVLLVRGAGDDDPDGTAGEDPATATPSATPTKADPDAFCAQFRKFADAQAQYVAAPEDPMAGEALVQAGSVLIGLGQPLGLSDAGMVSLLELVDSALAQEGDPVDVPTDAPADQAALDAYLGASCPA